jgi:hypothetical protein
MATKINVHGVPIHEVSSAHKSFGKSSGIPANDITREMAAAWKAQRERDMNDMPMVRLLGRIVPLDLFCANTWLAEKLRSLTTADGKRAVSDEDIDALKFALGRQAFGDAGKGCWRRAVALWKGAQKDVGARKRAKQTDAD